MSTEPFAASRLDAPRLSQRRRHRQRSGADHRLRMGRLGARARPLRRSGCRRALRAQCLPAHRRRQQRDGHRQARRDGPGRLHRHRHHRRGGTRCRLDAGAGRERARRCEALCQSRLRHDAGNRRQLGDGQLLDAAARGRRQGARDAARRGRQGMEGARRRSDRRTSVVYHAASKRQASFGSLVATAATPAGSGHGDAQGPQGFQADRPRRAARRRAGEVRRHARNSRSMSRFPACWWRCSSGRRCSARRSSPSMPPRPARCRASSRWCRCRAASRWSRRVSGRPSRGATR